jgi:Xaa-Pro aminopeptidase
VSNKEPARPTRGEPRSTNVATSDVGDRRREINTPFDSAELDKLMEAAGIDVLLATSAHNVRYLLGSPPFFFFANGTAFGKSRYLPIVVYLRGRPDDAHYVGFLTEDAYREHALWTPSVSDVSRGTRDAMEQATEYITRAAADSNKIGIEAPFLPADAFDVLRRRLPQTTTVDATALLERLRARKTPRELSLLREASERVLEAMLVVFAASSAGMTKNELVEMLRREEVRRGLEFRYCFIAAGTSLSRSPSDQTVQDGDVLSLDSGGSYHGYMGDIARMGVIGEPDTELDELLAEVETIQVQARQAVRPGGLISELWEAVEADVGRSKNAPNIIFEAHGMGLIGHEAPVLDTSVTVPNSAAEEPLEPGMMLSIETAIRHPQRGFIKLEDAVAVTETGFEVFGLNGRGWNSSRDGAAPGTYSVEGISLA